MFEGFKHTQMQTSDPEVRINLRYGGFGLYWSGFRFAASMILVHFSVSLFR